MTDARTETKAIMDRVNAILKAEFGDRIGRINGRFDNARVTMSIEIALGATPEARDDNLRGKFTSFAPMYGLTASDFDLPLVLNGKPCTLASVEPGRSKYPFVVSVTATGKRFKVDASLFLAARARKAAAHA